MSPTSARIINPSTGPMPGDLLQPDGDGSAAAALQRGVATTASARTGQQAAQARDARAARGGN